MQLKELLAEGKLFTAISTTASLDLDRIDSETLRKPFRPAKITFIPNW